MPAPKFWAYVKMMDVIRARNAISRINEMSLAFGSMSGETASEFIEALARTAAMAHFADEEQRPRVYRPKSPSELAALSGGTTTVMMQK